MSEYEHNEHLLDEIQRLRESNFYLREGCEELKQRIKRLEEAGDRMFRLLEHDGFESVGQNMWKQAKEAKP